MKKASNLLKMHVAADAALIENPINRRYFTGMNSSAGYLLYTKGNIYFIVDFRYFEAAEHLLSGTGIQVVLQGKLFEQINEILAKEKISTLSIESSFQTVKAASQYKSKLNCEIVADGELDKAISELRLIKNQAEIEKITQAQEITDKTFTVMLDAIKVGTSEKELAIQTEFFMRKLGADCISFDLITISGENTSLPHGTPTDRKLQKGDFVALDFGCKVDGYCSDMTRTVALGTVSEEQRHVYETVLQAQTASLAAIKPGVNSKEIDEIARSLINHAGYENCFGHGLGHGVGLEIHESPTLSPISNSVLKPGMVVTVEPGIYLKNKFGVRIEDLVVMTEQGYTNLTKSKKELIIL